MSGPTQQSVRREWQWFLFSLSCVAVTALLANEVVGKLGQWKHEPTYREIAVKALHEKHPEIVVVGSSHVRSGVDPIFFPVPAVTLAESGLDYEFAEILLRKHWEQVIQARIVVIEVSSVPIYQDTVGLRAGDFREFQEWGLNVSELPLSGWDFLEAAALERFNGTRYHKLFHELLAANHSNEPPFEREVGPGYHPRRDKFNRKQAEFALQELGAELNESRIEANLQAFERLVRDLLSAGVDVKLMRMPTHPGYREHQIGIQREAIAERAETIFLQMPGVEQDDLIDVCAAVEDADRNYADLTHLSDRGARVFSQALAEAICGKAAETPEVSLVPASKSRISKSVGSQFVSDYRR